jgi:hypothetical protein
MRGIVGGVGRGFTGSIGTGIELFESLSPPVTILLPVSCLLLLFHLPRSSQTKSSRVCLFRLNLPLSCSKVSFGFLLTMGKELSQELGGLVGLCEMIAMIYFSASLAKQSCRLLACGINTTSTLFQIIPN